jgi:hypothetical protein
MYVDILYDFMLQFCVYSRYKFCLNPYFLHFEYKTNEEKKNERKKKLKCRIVKFGGLKLHNYKIWGVKIVFKPKNYNLFFGYWYNKLNSKVILK